MIIGSAVRHYEKVSSTNDLASVILRDEKPPEGTVITASFQEGGRGQKGNSWHSEPGKNLLMSIILYPAMVRPEEQFVISQAVSLAVYDLVSALAPYVKIKWPNDIYVRDDKIAGILIENSIMGSAISSTVAGIGLNVNQTKFSDALANPVSLAQVTGTEYDISTVTGELLSLLDMRYAMVINGKSGDLAEAYHNSLYRCGEWHCYADRNGEFRGMIERVAPGGLLMVRRETGQVTGYAFREIDYIL
jgi:BirA family transcriptional regulator, biotin operon repressor / biotin---[acetyl-CoA-carboxylase] ligase